MKLTDKLCVHHVVKEGARFHVTSYALMEDRHARRFAVDWCSEPFCERNVWPVQKLVEHGLDPAKHCSIPRLAEWLSSPAGRAALQGKEEQR